MKNEESLYNNENKNNSDAIMKAKESISKFQKQLRQNKNEINNKSNNHYSNISFGNNKNNRINTESNYLNNKNEIYSITEVNEENNAKERINSNNSEDLYEEINQKLYNNSYLRTENEIEKDKKEEVNNKLDNENFERENENFIERKGINIYQNEKIFNKIIEENEV